MEAVNIKITPPSHILRLMSCLEAGGHTAWVVGGCVRDSLLGLLPHDWDMCTSASPGEMKVLFAPYPLVLSGEKHGTVGVVTEGSVVEITTYRSEGDYDDSRHPRWVNFEKNVEADLARRDFTVNAMAYHPERGLLDPWGGQADLKAGILRAVGTAENRFREDGLRILRGVRFAARFRLTPEEETLRAMTSLAPTLSLQARERVFAELCGFLPAARASDCLTFAPVLAAAIPELEPLMGFRQNNPHHAWDVFTHTAHCVQTVPPELTLRWAALLHDVGKPQTYTEDEQGIGHFKGHARLGADMADRILLELRSPKHLRREVAELIAHHGSTRDFGSLETDKPIRRLLGKLGEPLTRSLLALDRADERSKGTPPEDGAFLSFEARLDAILQEPPCRRPSDLAIGGRELMDMGVAQGKAVGMILNRLLEEVTDGVTENKKEPLLARAGELIKEQQLCIQQSK